MVYKIALPPLSLLFLKKKQTKQTKHKFENYCTFYGAFYDAPERSVNIYMNVYSVYKHTLPKEISGKDNDMVYIGITGSEPKKRWRKNGEGYKNNPYFWRSIQKYSWNNFTHDILYSGLTKEEAEQNEIELIALYKSDNREFGYNIEHGGNSRGKHSEESKQKMRDNHKDTSGENHPLYGKHHSDETKLLMSEIAKDRLSVKENNPFYNKHHTEETKKVLSEKAKERLRDKTKHPHYGHTREVICLDDNVIYPSVSYVSEKFGLSMAALYKVCVGAHDKCGGHRFRYLDLVEGAVG